jgi:hypothetical protein
VQGFSKERKRKKTRAADGRDIFMCSISWQVSKFSKISSNWCTTVVLTTFMTADNEKLASAEKIAWQAKMCTMPRNFSLI